MLSQQKHQILCCLKSPEYVMQLATSLLYLMTLEIASGNHAIRSRDIHGDTCSMTAALDEDLSEFMIIDRFP